MASLAIGAGVSALGSLLGAGMQSAAIKKAAAIQTTAAQQNATLEQNATNESNAFTKDNLGQIQNNENPYQGAGTAALSQLSQGTQAGGQFNSTPTSAQVMAQDPGFQFELNQGTQALQRAEAAGGSVGSGGALKAGVQYADNFADTSYNDAYSRFMNNRQSNYANLAGLVNYGQNANQVVANADTSASGLVSNTTLQGTAAQTNDLGQAANSQAAGLIGSTNAWSGALSSLGTSAQQAIQGYNLNSGYQATGPNATPSSGYNDVYYGPNGQVQPLSSLGVSNPNTGGYINSNGDFVVQQAGGGPSLQDLAVLGG